MVLNDNGRRKVRVSDNRGKMLHWGLLHKNRLRCLRPTSSRRARLFLRSLMLDDKTDFYKDTALYARLKGAGFMHIVAVSGVLYLFLGFFGIARKPVKWGFSDHRRLLST